MKKTIQNVALGATMLAGSLGLLQGDDAKAQETNSKPSLVSLWKELEQEENKKFKLEEFHKGGIVLMEALSDLEGNLQDVNKDGKYEIDKDELGDMSKFFMIKAYTVSMDNMTVENTERFIKDMLPKLVEANKGLKRLNKKEQQAKKTPDMWYTSGRLTPKQSEKLFGHASGASYVISVENAEDVIARQDKGDKYYESENSFKRYQTISNGIYDGKFKPEAYKHQGVQQISKDSQYEQQR